VSIEEGLEQFDEAQHRLEDHEPDWSGTIRNAIENQLRRTGTFDSNDLNHLDIPEGIRKRVVGAVIGGAAAAGLMECVGRSRSTRTESHGRGINRYEITDHGRAELGAGVDVGKATSTSVDPGGVPAARQTEGACLPYANPRHELDPGRDEPGSSSPPIDQVSPHAGVDAGPSSPVEASVDPGDRSIAPAEAQQRPLRSEPDPDLSGRGTGSGSTTSDPPAEPEQLELLTGGPAGDSGHIDIDQRRKAA
jgi:hypothetical protein